MDIVKGVKLSKGTQVDEKTGKKFEWDTVLLYMEHEEVPKNDQFSEYFGHCCDCVKFSKNNVALIGIDRWQDLVNLYVRLNYTIFNGKPVLRSVEVLD